MTKKETASEKYWNRRRELEDKALLNAENETIRELTTEIFPGALKKIQEKLLSQSNLHNMTQSELLENFSNRDQKKYRDYVNNNYQELMSSDKKYQEFIDEYFPPYDYAKINRLTQMRADIFSIMASEMIKSDVNQKFNTRLEDVVNKMYGSNSKALFQLLGTGEVHALPKKELEDMLNYPWSGKTFSNRLWGNVSRLEQNLSLSIVNAATSGDGVLSVLKDMKGNDEISSMFKQEEGKFNRAIENLVRTEYAHFAVEGVKKSLDDAGIKNKQSWSAEDERVCSICGGRHGKLITDDWYPPYHGRCRCSLIPKMPELSEDIDEIYEEMFGSLLDEFAKDNFGINLTHPEAKKTKMRYNKDRKGFEIKNHDLSRNEAIKKLYDEFEMSIEETARTKLSETALNQTYSVLEGFKDLYNALPEKIPKVRAVTKSEAKDAIAWYSRKASNNTPVEFGINVAYFKGDEDLTNLVQNQVNSGWFSKNSSANHVMIHEFAHHIDHQLTGLHGSQFSNAVFARMAESDDSKYNFDNLSKQIGGYANTYYYKYKKHTESFAEIFAEAYGETPREIALDFKREFEKLSKEVIDDVDAT